MVLIRRRLLSPRPTQKLFRNDISFCNGRSLAMKASKLIWFSSLLICALCAKKIRIESLVPHAINVILSKPPMKDLWDVEVISYGGKSEKTIEKLLRSKKTSTAITVTQRIKGF